MTKASAGLPWTHIIAGETDKARLWAVNTETQYHEERTVASTQPPEGPESAFGAPGCRSSLSWHMSGGVRTRKATKPDDDRSQTDCVF